MLTLLYQKITYKFNNMIFFDKHILKYEDHIGQLRTLNMIMNSLKIIIQENLP